MTERRQLSGMWLRYEDGTVEYVQAVPAYRMVYPFWYRWLDKILKRYERTK